MNALQETELPPSAHLLRLLPNTDPDSGIVVFTARPARAEYVQGQDLLASLGKDNGVTGGGRRHTEDTLLSQAWLLAHEVHTIVVRSAEQIESAYITTLHMLASAVGATLILCRNDDSGQHVLDYVRNHGGTRIPADDIIITVQRAATTLGEPGPDSALPLPKYLPRYDFPLFRDACRHSLTQEEFRLVDSIYVESFRAARDAKPNSATTVRSLLDRLFGSCTMASEAIVITRAVQAAMFLDGQHLEVDFDGLTEHETSAHHRRLTSAEVRSLRAYREPWRSSAAALSEAGITVQEMRAIPVSAVTETGTVDGISIHPEAHVFLRAQRLLRTLQGAAPTDALLHFGERYIHTALRAVTHDLGFTVVARRVGTRPRRRLEDRWQHRLGVTVQPLINPAATGWETP